MDNLTHSTLGVLLAASSVEVARKRGITLSPGQVRAVYLTSLLTNNLPDLDFLIPILSEAHSPSAVKSLSYLLHHRGHTHTLGVALLLGLVTAAACVRSAQGWSVRGKRIAFGVGALGAVFHILADSWNDYGVHPFWPLDSSWYYGGFIFIIEPSIWMALFPVFLRYFSTRASLIFFGACVVGAVSLVATSAFGLGGFPNAIPMSVFVVLMVFLVSGLLRTQRPLTFAWARFVGVLLVFFVGSRLARWEVERQVRTLGPERVELSSTPPPANPFCYRVLRSSSASRDSMIVGEYVVSLWPSQFPPESCFFGGLERGGVGVAAVFRSGRKLGERVFERWAYSASIAEGEKLACESPFFRSALQFYRFPFWMDSPSNLVIGDLRYDRRGGGFGVFSENKRERLPAPTLGSSWKSPSFLDIEACPSQTFRQ